MYMENGIKEVREIEGTKDGKQEFSPKALAKFDQILEDDKIGIHNVIKQETPESDKDECERKNVKLSEKSETVEKDLKSDDPEKDLEKVLDAYFKDMKEKSECSDTFSDKPFDVRDLKKITPEENALMREEFADKKEMLKRNWEEVNGREWPQYEQDVYSANGNLIRKAGSDYDAHHIQPLGMGGKNEASNITPLNAQVHYDKQGVHAADSPYSTLNRMLGGMDE